MADARHARQEESGPGPEIMRLLEQALRPVEPSTDFMGQLEGKLANIEAAALEALEEVADWEFDAMRDPRNWVRPVAAVAVGTAAASALVVLGLRSRRRRTQGLRALAESGGKVANEALTSARGLIRP
jgi:negative regulator of sigma E activity